MDTLSSLLMFWILILLSPTCKSETTCASDNFDMYTCCFNYTTPTSEIFIIKCPNTTSSIVVNDIVHLHGSGICSDIDVAFGCSINNPDIVWRSNTNKYLSDETCLNTNYTCRFEIEPIPASDICNDTVHRPIADWSDAVRLTFKCNGGEDASMSTAFTTSTDFVSTNLEDKTSQAIDLGASSSTTNDVPIVETSIPSFSPEYEISYPSTVRSVSYEELPSSTFPTSTGIMTYSTKAPAQQNSAGAIGGGIAAVVVVIVIIIIVILIVRRRKLQEAEKKNNVDNTKSDSNGQTYIDIDSTKTKPKKSQYEEVYATQEKDFPLKHCDSHETSHYCYVGSNECHGKGHTNDEEKPQYDNVENMTYDNPKTNRVDKQDQNHYDNINEEVENKNNERIDLYAVPNKAKTGVSGDNNKMSLKRNMDGSDYSIYPTLPAKCFETLAEDPDRPKYAEIDMEKSGISASSRKNVDAKPSEDLNYAQIQF